MIFKFPFEYSDKYESLTLLNSDTEIYLNDDNLKPNWVKIPAAFSEFHIKRKKDTLLLVIGESWTYGESLPGIASAIGKFDIFAQLQHGFGSKMAMTLDSDLYQYAVPGNCNLYMFHGLERILENVSSMGYRKIYVCQQLTEQGRDNQIRQLYPDHPINELYDKTGLWFTDWLREYDEIFCSILNNAILQNRGKTEISAILWRNFCKSNTARRDYHFKTIESTWIEYSSRLLGQPLESPDFYVAGWLDYMQQHYAKQINFDFGILSRNLDKIERSNQFIKSNLLHNNHPNTNSHSLWAQYLIRQAGWAHDI